MKTAREVLEAVDRAIEKMQAEAVGPCIDALIEWTDRDAYKDAMRRAYGLKAVQALREQLAAEVEDCPAPVIKKATNMLLCGEDLGMVPACVPSVMNELGILSLEVQRMPKDPKITFGHPAEYPYLSVATPSSHDTSTVRGWWEEDRGQTQKFYNEILGNFGSAPEQCTTDVVRQIIIQHLYSPSMWAVFPIQDLLGMDETLRLPNANAERINHPGNPNHYWRYRLHLNLEDLVGQNDFNEFVREQIRLSGRLDIY